MTKFIVLVCVNIVFLYYCNTEIREFDGANAKLFCTKIVNFAKLAVNFCPKKMCFLII